MIAAKDFCSKSYDAATDRYQKLQTAVADGKTRFETYAVEYFKLVDESLQGVKGKLKEVSSLDAKEVVATKLTEMKAMLVNANQVSKDHLTHHFAQLQSAWASLLERPEGQDLCEVIILACIAVCLFVLQISIFHVGSQGISVPCLPAVASALEYTNSSVQSLTARAELIHDAIVVSPSWHCVTVVKS